MRTPFDDESFAGLLAAQASPSAGPLAGDALHAVPATEPPRRAQDWGEAPDTLGFVGRAEELALLRGWVLEERCRVVRCWA